MFAVILILYLVHAAVGAGSFKQDHFMTPTEEEIFKKFEATMIPKLELDFQKEKMYLLRFLRSNNFDLVLAEESLLTEAKFRKDNNMETIHSEDWSDISRDYSMRVEGHGREGQPLIFYDVGDWDIRKAAIAGKTERLIRWTTKNFDMARIKVREAELQGKNVSRWLYLTDLKNINDVTNANKLCFPFYVGSSLGYEDHFPLWGEEVIMINTPQLWNTILAIIRPLLSKETDGSLKVLGTNRAEWEPYLKAKVDPTQLPKRYGGSKENP